MIWFLALQLFSTFLDWLSLARRSTQEKDLQILLLRRQLAILERKHHLPVQISRAEKLTPAVLAAQLRAIRTCLIRQMDDVIRLFQPVTIFTWHRDLVRRKWTYQRKAACGRPRTKQDIECSIVQLAHENSDWGNGRIERELIKFGYHVSEQAIANILKRYGIPPAPQRQRSPSWRHLMTHYQDQILACDFFTVETLFLKTLYILVFIELGSRRIHFAGCTDHPSRDWVTQQARQVVWELEARKPATRFLIHDRDAKFTSSFDCIFQSERIKIVHTPIRAPNANAFMERWMRTVREECLDKRIIINQAHLRHVLYEYINYYNSARPHQGIAQQTPIPRLLSRRCLGMKTVWMRFLAQRTVFNSPKWSHEAIQGVFQLTVLKMYSSFTFS